MGVKDLLTQIGVKLPEGVGSGAGDFVQAFIFLLVLGFVVAGIASYFANKRQYNKHIDIFGEVGGKTVQIGSDKAKEIILPNTSIRAFYLQKRKVFLPRPSIQTGISHYLFFIRDDGEWMNVGFGNLNAKLKELNFHYDHTDMRMANASLKKLIEKNYKKLNWIKEYAPYIAIGILILLLGITAFLILNQAGKLIAGLSSSAETNRAVVEKLGEILGSMDRICTGSGIRGA